MMRGLNVGSGAVAGEITKTAFARGLMIETSGPHDEVVKVLAPLTIDEDALKRGLDILEACVREVIARRYGVAAE